MSEEVSDKKELLEKPIEKRGRKKRKGKFHKLTLRLSQNVFEDLKINGDPQFSLNAQVEKILEKALFRKKENVLIEETRFPAILTLKLKDLTQVLQKDQRDLVFVIYDMFESFLATLRPENLEKFNAALKKKGYAFKE